MNDCVLVTHFGAALESVESYLIPIHGAADRGYPLLPGILLILVGKLSAGHARNPVGERPSAVPAALAHQVEARLSEGLKRHREANGQGHAGDLGMEALL